MAPDSEPADLTPGVGLRTHPASAFVRVWLFVVAAGVGAIQSILEEFDLPLILLVLAAGVVVGSAVGGVVWWFTTFVIDGRELRIDSGMLTKKSRRIPYERIQSVDIAQPLGARIFGLAELRIEMAGGDDSRSQLQFLKHADASRLRALLLDRAHLNAPGTETDDAAAAPSSRTSEVIATVSPQRLVMATLISLDLIASAIALVVVLVVAVVVSSFVPLLSAIVPLGSWFVQIIVSRVIAQWGFTLSRTPGGLRIERGLLSRTSQTVPFDRVQGIAVKQPMLWRRLGWQRLEVDVAGYAAGDDDDSSSSTLLPVGDHRLAQYVISQLMPDVRAGEVQLVPAPRRSAWFAPIGWRFRAAGADDHAFVSRRGWIQRRHDVVPHRKTQSVALEQGPLQRRLGVADVSIHTPDGPVSAQGKHLGDADALALAYGQLERARAARD